MNSYFQNFLTQNTVFVLILLTNLLSTPICAHSEEFRNTVSTNQKGELEKVQSRFIQFFNQSDAGEERDFLALLNAYTLNLSKRYALHSKKNQNNELAFIKNELIRIKLFEESIKRDAPNKFTNFKAQILRANRIYLEGLNNSEEKSNDDLVTEIVFRLFSPCQQELKSSPYCYTLGVIIHKMGKKFLNPYKFQRTRKDFIRYLTLSGIRLPTAIKNIDWYLVPSAHNKKYFRRCHSPAEIEQLIPPQMYWPRSIVLISILENIAQDIKVQKEMNLISQHIMPIHGIHSWWRSKCYHSYISNGNKNSDHIYGAAFDLSFTNKESFKYHRDFIEKFIWQDDLFDIRYPLEQAQLSFSIGVGLGHGYSKKGKMHFGITSPIGRAGQLRQWQYGQYSDVLKH